MIRDIMTAYGPIGLDRVDIRSSVCCVVDLTKETGGPSGDADGSAIFMPPHPFELSVMKPIEGEYPIGEILFWLHGKQVHLVGKLTTRNMPYEITPDILVAAKDDQQYLTRIRQWLGLAAA